jgi:hypothetical protein
MFVETSDVAKRMEGRSVGSSAAVPDVAASLMPMMIFKL